MKLYFTCPQTKTDFLSDDYSLREGHRIVEDEHGGKHIEGVVFLNSPCPLCGEKHQYEAKDVMCPITSRNISRAC